MLTKKPTFMDLGLLKTYKTQQHFPVTMLTAAGVSQTGIDFVLSLMHPDPNDRVTAGSAIYNAWLQPLIPCSPKSTTDINGDPQIPSSVSMLTEDYASWTTNPSSEAPKAVADSIDLNLPQVKGRWSTELQVLESHSLDFESLNSSPNGRMLASGSYDGTVRLWDPATGTLHRTLKHSRPINSVAFSPDGRLLACCCDDETVRLWDPMTGALHRTLSSDSTYSAAFSPDGRLLACGSDDNTVRLYDPVTGALHQTLKGHSNCVMSVAFSPDGRMLASGSADSKVRLWDHATKARLWDRVTGALHQTLKGHSDVVKSVAFSSDGRMLASGSYDSKVCLWDTATGKLRQTLHTGSPYSVAFSPDSRMLESGFPMLASASTDNTIHFWDTATGALHQILRGHLDPIYSLAFSPTGRLLASGSSDSTVRLWDPMTGTLQRTLRGHSATIYSVAFSPDGRLLESVSSDNTVRSREFLSS
jgi:WD40 repeat protein